MQVVTIGDSLPTISVETNKGKINLGDYNGQFLLIYFYPKDDTPGCTIESKDFRDLYPEFQKRNAEILGVSRDSVKSHQSFCDKYDLPFPLISDGDEELCTIFDVIKQKKLYGREYMGIERSTFLFDSQGKLVQQWRNVKVPDHAQKVLTTLDNII